jgi:hypothetical protein
MRTTFKILVAGLVVGAVWVPREALALGPVDLEIAAQVGGGTSTVGSGDVNALGLGFGARAGVDVLGFYAGVAGMYYVGSGGSEPDAEGAGGDVHTYRRSALLGVEGGYNLNLSILTLRPQLGLGYYYQGVSFSEPSTTLGAPGSTSQDTSSIYIEPGAAALFSFGMWFAGADVGVLWVPAVNDSQAAVVVHGQLGVKL